MIACLRTIRTERLAFWGAVLAGGMVFWLSPRLPMADLAQHAAQITLLRDLAVGQSEWSSLVQINWFTPYIVGYVATFVLSLALPISTAIATLLTLSYWVSIAFLVALRKKIGGDERLDWLFIPGFFGFAFAWGFYPFLIAEPLAVIVIYLSWCHARVPSYRIGAALLLFDILLFFSHGLAFLLANAIGGLFLLVAFRSWSRLVSAATPFILCAILCLAFVAIHVPNESAASGTFLDVHFDWHLSRLGYLLFFPSGNPKADWLFAPLRMVMAVAPFLLCCRLNRQSLAAWVPFSVLLVVWLAVPNAAMNTIYLYQRFDVFLLAFYAMVFQPPERQDAGPLWLQRAALAYLPILCATFLVVQGERVVAFGAESADFDELLAVTQPGQRALSLILDNRSPAARNTIAYNSYALWYQAHKNGLVDYNFSITHTAVVRYRRTHEPPDLTESGWSADKFRWDKAMPGPYRYFFVRHTAPLPSGYALSGKCAPVLLKRVGAWTVFENVNCYNETFVGTRLR